MDNDPANTPASQENEGHPAFQRVMKQMAVLHERIAVPPGTEVTQEHLDQLWAALDELGDAFADLPEPERTEFMKDYLAYREGLRVRIYNQKSSAN
jgi:hypothetical protein